MKRPLAGTACASARHKTAGVLLAALFFASCATVPRLVETKEDFDLLDGGGRIYFVADVSVARPILDHAGFSGLFGADAAELLDRTSRASVALYDSAPSGKTGEGGDAASVSRRFHLAARGNYPASRAGIGLGLSTAWQKEKSRAGGTYWRSGAGLALYLTARTALVSDADPLFRAAAPERPPAHEGHAVIRLETPAPAQARALTFILNTARSYAAGLPRSRDRITAFALAVISSPAELDENALILRTPPLDAETIALLFRLFSI